MKKLRHPTPPYEIDFAPERLLRVCYQLPMHTFKVLSASASGFFAYLPCNRRTQPEVACGPNSTDRRPQHRQVIGGRENRRAIPLAKADVAFFSRSLCFGKVRAWRIAK